MIPIEGGIYEGATRRYEIRGTHMRVDGPVLDVREFDLATGGHIANHEVIVTREELYFNRMEGFDIVLRIAAEEDMYKRLCKRT
jgi:hypothetical protein